MRWLALACVLVPTLAWGQSLGTGVSSAVLAVKRAGKLPVPIQQLPTGERVPQRPATTPRFPAPEGDENEFRLIKTGAGKVSGNKVLASGGVELLYKGYRCIADSVDGDRVTEIFRFSGGVRVVGKDASIVGESVVVDFKRQTFSATYGKAEIQPNLLGNQITGNIFLGGQQTYGNSKKVEGRFCDFTTCDKEFPHFHFDSERATIEPGKQAILRDVKIVILGKTVLRLPILWIPLGDRSYKYLPTVGQTPDEGYFVKNRYGFPMGGEDRGAIRADYMSKLGTGLGGEYYYRNANLNGMAKVYGVFGNSNTLTVTNQHEQRFGAGTLTLDTDFQRNNYLTAPGSTLLNNRGLFRFQGNLTSLGFNRTEQKTTGYSSTNQTITFNDNRNWGKTSSTLDMTMSQSNSTGGAERKTIDVRYRGQTDVKKGLLSLEYQRTIPIGDVTNFFPGSDRTPVIAFASDSTKLMGSKAPKTLPFRTELSIGEFLDPVIQRRVSRGTFDMNFNRSAKDVGNWKWDFNGNFRQSVYSDNTAQYRVNAGTALTYSIGKRLSANVRYSYLRPSGYSPLVIDRTGRTNLATFDFSYKFNSKSSLGLQTGYDIERADRSEIPWQQVGIRTEYRLGSAFNLRTLSTYDTFRQSWSNIRIDTAWQTDTLTASLGARYDGIRSTWSNFNFYLDGLQLGRTRVGTVLNFNGYTGRLDSQQYNFVYDLHCAEAILLVSDYGTGFRSGREIGFFIRLKSVPFNTNFGTGRRGQGLGSGTGRDF